MSFKFLTIGNNSPQIVNTVIEIPGRSSNKYEYDEKLDLIKLDRVLHSPMFYKTDYGFIPETRSEDGDHLDILVLITEPTFPGCVLTARPVGMLELHDEAGKDWKIIAIAEHDPYYKEVRNLDQINLHLKKEIKHFFESYKYLEENKKTLVGDWFSREETYKIIKEAQERYKK